MNELFENEDLFLAFLDVCETDELEELYSCSSDIKKFLNGASALARLVIRFELKVPRKLSSFWEFLIRYYRRFNDYRDRALLWAIEDCDMELVRFLLDKYNLYLDRNNDPYYYGMFFCAGKHDDIELFNMLDEKGLKNRVSNKTMFLAGKVYAGHTVLSKELESIDEEKLSLILFEAIRGKHLHAIEEVEKLLARNKNLIKHVHVIAAVVTDNLKNLQVLLEDVSDYANWRNFDIPIIEEGDLIYSFERDKCSIFDELIQIALHYRSQKVLEFLASDYKLDHRFNDDLRWYKYKPDIYLWIRERQNEHFKFTPEGIDRLLSNAACADNLSLVKELRQYLPVDGMPNWFDEVVECNAYRVAKWLLREFQYDPLSLEPVIQEQSKSNTHAYHLVLDYYNKAQVK